LCPEHRLVEAVDLRPVEFGRQLCHERMTLLIRYLAWRLPSSADFTGTIQRIPIRMNSNLGSGHEQTETAFPFDQKRASALDTIIIMELVDQSCTGRADSSSDNPF
jgi:hypothetical protein